MGSVCAHKLQAVTSAFELAWNDSTMQSQLFKLFSTQPSRLTKADFAWMLADSAAMGDQYGCATDIPLNALSCGLMRAM